VCIGGGYEHGIINRTLTHGKRDLWCTLEDREMGCLWISLLDNLDAASACPDYTHALIFEVDIILRPQRGMSTNARKCIKTFD
jgi:hypothetical protein